MGNNIKKIWVIFCWECRNSCRSNLQSICNHINSFIREIHFSRIKCAFVLGAGWVFLSELRCTWGGWGSKKRNMVHYSNHADTINPQTFIIPPTKIHAFKFHFCCHRIYGNGTLFPKRQTEFVIKVIQLHISAAEMLISYFPNGDLHSASLKLK